jgi:hypothetical protein
MSSAINKKLILIKLRNIGKNILENKKIKIK